MKKSQKEIPMKSVRAEMEMLAGEIADLKNRQRAGHAEMDAAMNEVRRRYREILSGLDAQIAARMKRAREWAESNPSEFGAAKSLDLPQAVAGFRLGRPQLKTLSGWTWKRVLGRLKTLPGGGEWLRTKAEINKQQLLLQRDQLGAERLREIGLRVTQEETFYVEPKASEVERRERLAA